MTDRELPEGFIEVTSMGDDNPTFLGPDGAQYTLEEVNAILADPDAFFHGDQQAVTAYEPQSQVPAHLVPAPVHTWQDSDPEALQQALTLRSQNRRNLMDWIRDALIEGTDYGRIHVMPKSRCKEGNRCTNEFHYSKPCLWKAGAEKITGMLGLRAEWPDLERVVKHITKGGERIILRCHLVNPDGNVLSEGIGGRSTLDDAGDVNKALKMAKKSSLIDAVLNACGLSEVFTQDIAEDDNTRELAVNQTLDEDGQRYLKGAANELFGSKGPQVLDSLIRRRFQIDDGDISRVPAYRLQDAIRSLEEKAASEEGDQ